MRKKKSGWRMILLVSLPIIIINLFVIISETEPEKLSDRLDELPYTSNSIQRVNSTWVSELEFDRNGNLWVGTDKGLCVVQVKNCSQFELRGNYINSITLDSERDLWVGTNRSGVKVFDGKSWTTYNNENSDLPDNAVHAIQFDDQGKAWIGTNSGLSIFDGGEWITYTTVISMLPNDFVNEISFDSIGNVWIGTHRSGVKVFDGKTWTTYNENNTIMDDYSIEEISFDESGKAWIGTSGGAYIFDLDNWEKIGFHYNTDPAVYVITFDAQGRPWMGGTGMRLIFENGPRGGGLAILDEEELVIFVSSISNFSPHAIHDILFDSDGFAWIATQAGLFSISEDLAMPIPYNKIQEIEVPIRYEYKQEQQYWKDTWESKKMLLYPLGTIWLIILTIDVVLRIPKQQIVGNQKKNVIALITPIVLGLLTFFGLASIGFGFRLAIYYATETHFFFLLLAIPWVIGLGIGLLSRKVMVKIYQNKEIS